MRGLLGVALLSLLAPSQDAETLAQSASKKAKSGDYRGAEADLTRAIESGGKTASSCHLRGYCRYFLDDFEGSATDLTDAIELGDRRTETFSLRGMARYHAGDPRGALSDLSEGPDEPTSPAVLMVRGYAYFALESWANALRDFTAAARDESKKAPLLGLRWLARAHLQDRDAAAREFPTPLPEGWLGRIAAFLSGSFSSEELVRAAAQEPESLRPKALGRAWYYIASKEYLDGKEAAPLFRKALELHGGSDAYARLAQDRLDGIAERARRKILDLQEERFRAVRRFHAEFRLRSLSKDGKEIEKDKALSFSMDIDRENRRFFGTIPKGTPKHPEGMNIFVDKLVLTAWTGGDRGRRMDYSDVFETVERRDAAMVAELDRLLPPDPGYSRRSPPRELKFILALEGKPSATEEGAFRFAVGQGQCPCSWTRDGIRHHRTTVRDEGEDIVIEIPSREKRIILDKAFGFPKMLEARDYDGTRRQFVRTSFSAEGTFPAVEVPAKPAPNPPDGSIEQAWQDLQLAILCLRLEDVVGRWEKVVQSGKERDLQKLFAGWLAQHLDTTFQFNVRRAARHYVRWLLDQGEKWADLKANGDDTVRRFKAWAAPHHPQLLKLLRGQLDLLSRQAFADLVEDLMDNRHHPILRRLRKECFDFDVIEALRRAGDDAKMDRILREELEAVREL